MTNRQWKIAILFLVLFALLGALMAWIVIPKPFAKPYYLTLVISEYEDNHYPSLPFADQDRDLLAHTLSALPADAPTTSQQGRLPLHALGTLAKRQENTVVVYLRAHGVVAGQEVLLLPGDARPDRPDTGIALDEVLETISKCPARRKLLLLDLMGPLEDPRLGILTQDVAGAIQEKLKEEAPEGLLVLCACGAGQRSLVSEELRQSIFAHYLSQGLQGQADSGPQGNHNHRVTVAELVSYATAQVERWARQNRRLQQSPIVLGDLSAFGEVELALVQEPPEEEPKPAGDYPEFFQAQWKKRDDWWQDEKTFRAHPRVFRQLESALVRAEQRWRGGRDSNAIRDSLRVKLKDWDRQAEDARELAFSTGGVRPHSLALIKPAASEAVLDQLSRFLAEAKDLPPPMRDMKLKDFLTQLRAAKVSATDLAGMVLTAANDETAPPTKERVELLGQVLDRYSEGRPVRCRETLLLNRLARWQDYQAKDWPREPVRLLLETATLEERLLARDPCALAWFLPALEQAAGKRRQGRESLFRGQLRTAPVQLKEARLLLLPLAEQVETVEGAQRTLDEALVLLPGLFLLLVQEQGGSGVLDPLTRRSREDQWQEAASQVEALLQLLQPTTRQQPEGWTEALAQKRIALQQKLTTLCQPFGKSAVDNLLARIKRNEAASPADYNTIQILLQSPLPGAKQRIALLQAGRELGKRLQDQPGHGNVPDSPPARELALRKARLVLDLLRLAQAGKREELQARLTQAERGLTQENLQQLADQARKSWKGVAQQLEGEQNPWAALRLGLALHPIDDRDVRPFAAQVRQEQRRHYWAWLSKYLEDDAAAPSADEAERDFYRGVAGDYRRALAR